MGRRIVPPEGGELSEQAVVTEVTSAASPVLPGNTAVLCAVLHGSTQVLRGSTLHGRGLLSALHILVEMDDLLDHSPLGPDGRLTLGQPPWGGRGSGVRGGGLPGG